MHLVVIGPQDGPQHVTVTADPQRLHGRLQSKRSVALSIHHKVDLDVSHADTVLEYAHALMAEREGVSMAVLAHEAVKMLYASRNLPLPMKEK
jgi:hypothetical protein